MAEDSVDLLLDQHGRIDDLFVRISKAAPADRGEPWRELRGLLTVHETVEEELVHPVAESLSDGTAEVAADRVAEEVGAEELLRRLADVDPESDEFPQAFKALRTAVLSHAAHEERYEFPRLKAYRSDELAALAPRVAAGLGVADDTGDDPPETIKERVAEAVREADA
ncbi:hemerythrin HHE cation binding domain-containing protein [Stackebrandtia albiflava]|uniref:Hemerythrin HHE cation binding domain-containing protein n=1 Tax=Stackebrandtia albiflava TaxID=406432 RepID=A0A562VA19_9ACTN|nr:hemerythrin domain-containing protein [Stackebrandtia albiflava]TWJ14726.1 hemerythrin HHE cation binding domain-containing protein [Stackebrandtia albiflava]